MLRVAKAAFDYKHIDDDKRFNAAMMAQEFRDALNGPKAKTRKRAVNEPTPKEVERMKRVRVLLPRIDEQLARRKPKSPTTSTTSEGTTTNISWEDDRTSSEEGSPTNESNGKAASDLTSNEGDEKMKEKPPANSSPPAEVSPPKSGGSKVQKKRQNSKYDVLLDFATNGGGTVNEIIAGLNEMLAQFLSRRRKTKFTEQCAAKVNELIVVLYKTPPTQSWRDQLVKYKDVLERM